MRDHSRRKGCLAASIIAGTVIALGWMPFTAPAKDATTPKGDKQWLTEPQREEAGRAVIEMLQTNGVPAVHLEQHVDRPSSPATLPQENSNLYVTIGDRPVRMITSFDATPIAGGGLATGGATPNGGACTCDSQCMAAAGECQVAHCVGGICMQENAPVDTTCNNDANFCTQERCNDVGVCIDTTVNPSSAVRISPCSKQCCVAATCTLGSFQNCFEASDCPGTEGCFPKRQASSGQLYRAQCDEANDRCFVDRVPTGTPNAAVGNPVGRCCTVGGACSLTEELACAGGQWWRLRDPDDSLHTCNATDGCPKYGSGIAPDGAHVTGIGPIVPPARRCSIGGNICEVNADCIDRCNGGIRANESCDTDVDCPGALCLPGGALDICTNDPDECQGVGTFTSVGDDYSLSNGSYMRLSEFRFRGGSREPNEIALFEFYDSAFSPARLVNAFTFRFANAGDFDYRVIVDCFPNCDSSQPQGSPFVENRADPPFIIPPNGFVVMRATRLGAILSPVSTQFGEDDGNLFWYTTDAVDVGSNNASSMWINGVVGNNPATAADVLSFELLGTKIPAPLAACCDPSTGNCTDRVQWDCSFCTDPARTVCDRGRDCGLNAEFTCSTRDWKGARSAAEVIADGYKVCGQRYCHGPNAPDGTSIECTGTGQGNCPVGHLCEESCETAACCTPTGCVEVATVAACNGLNGTILGFGQRCEPNCCPQTLTGVDCCKDFYSCFAGANDTSVTCDFRCSVTTAAKCTEDYECPMGETCVVNPGSQADCPGGQTCQLVCDGPDGNADPRIHAIDVPTYVDGSERVIVDFQGSTSTAVFLDDCVGSGAGADAGHYQFFTLDECAELTINLCCSNPIASPVAQTVTLGCPCNGVGTSFFTDVNANGQQSGFGTTCNNDFCCTDGNWSIQFTLPPGSYTYQVLGDKSCSNSTTNCFADADCDPGTWCSRNNTVYQGHFVAKPCAPGACCGAPGGGVEPFCDVVDLFTCQNERKYCQSNQAACDNNADCPPGDSCLAGVFLGDKIVSPVPLCDGDPCSLGACCLGPGICEDNAGTGISFAACSGQGGAFIGGFRCNENPCPVCPVEVQDNCQSAATGTFIFPSDRLLNQRRADDFRAAGSVIRRICFHPCYIGVTADNQGFECNGNGAGSGTPPPDAFIAKFYEDDFGVPGPLVAGVPANGLALTIDAKSPDDGGAGGSRCWRYTAPILPPAGLSVIPGDCYWLEITGLGEAQTGGTCVVQWESSGDGNAYAMRDTNGVYELTDAFNSDFAFCIDSGIIGATSPPTSLDGGCGNFPVACCKPGPNCIDGGTYQQCIGTPSAPVLGIPFPYLTCSQVPGGCPQPPNDNCADAITPAQCTGQASNPNLGVCSVSGGPPNIMEVCDMTVGSAPAHDCPNSGATCQPRPANTDAYRCIFATDSRLANTDGPNTQGAGVCFSSGINSFQADIWYRYTAPCTGTMTVQNCSPSLNTYDSMFQVFGNHSPTCTTCPIANNSQNLGCTDDQSCGTAGGGGGLAVNVTEGGCYTIRLGGWSSLGAVSDAGQNISGLDIGVVCLPDVPGNPPVVPSGGQAVHARLKNRYISFMPNNGATSVAFRVQRAAIANGAGFCTTSGAACTGAPAQGTCAGGQLCVAPFPGGTPAHSCWVQTPVQAGGDINTAKCDAAPVFRTWTEPVVHVGDCEIVPNSDYTVFTNVAGPVEVPTGLAIKTAEVASLNTKVWADSVGSFNGVEWTPPNRFTNVQDVLSILARISNAVGAPQFTVVNLQAVSAPDSCLNAFVNTADVLIAVRGVAGDRYGAPDTGKVTNTTLCPVCP